MAIPDLAPLELDLQELEPLPPAQSPDELPLPFSPSSSASGNAHSSHSSARYVTVSAILSRSGTVYPLRSNESYDGAQGSIFAALPVRDDIDDPSTSRGRDEKETSASFRSRRPSGGSNGNALEAIGTLLLHRDRTGRASTMSFQRYNGKQDNLTSSSSSTSSQANLASTYRAFLDGLRQVSASTLGIQLPSAHSQGGKTIAERRARSRARGEMVRDQDGSLFIRVRSGRNKPTFDISRPPTPERTSITSASTSTGVHPRRREPLADPRLAFRRAHSSAAPAAVYGFGSTFGIVAPPEAPPSPLGMPGDWPGGRGWKSPANSSDDDEDFPLLLPPPLLDDRGSDPKSFEGLLGIRRRREQEEVRRRLERLAARNRPAHKVGMLTAIGNFVKAAHAADLASRKKSSAQKDRLWPRRPSRGLERRHTDAHEVMRAKELSLARQKEEEISADEAKTSKLSGILHRHPSARRSSLLESPSLETVYERTSPSAGGEGQSFHHERAPSRRRSVASRRTLSVPPSPRLLPVHLSVPPSPMTPHDGYAVDYLSAVGGLRSPLTPHLGPTMLSLPPSPWTPHLRGREPHQNFSFALMATSVPNTAPGTPRLAPTLLSVLPSPLATGSVTESGRNAFWSPPQSTTTAGNATPGRRSVSASPLSLQPLPDEISLPPVRRRKVATQVDGQAPTTLLDSPPRRPRAQSRDRQPASAAVTSPSSRVTPPSSLLVESRADRLLVAFNLIVDFLHFCLIHLIDLVYEVAEHIAMAYWFMQWMILNLTGRTALSRCLYEAFALIQAEWALVAEEDHEEKRQKSAHGDDNELGDESDAQSIRTGAGAAGPPGLTRWQVCRGLLELIALQTVTKERWIFEGSGLTPLDGWQRKQNGNGPRKDLYVDEDLYASDSDDDETELIVTRREADVLEFTRTPRIKPKEYHPTGSTSTSAFNNSGTDDYFAQATGSKTSCRPSTNTPRSLVKTIKWASRLAIGAYGLHVHIVDLPPTFTPSGKRFTRQTFAHLSRLSNPDDVLHADIQQMSAVGEGEGEDIYQPTFYVARDHVRKMIVVAVRGTQSFSDIIADLDMRTAKFPLNERDDDQGQEQGHEDFSCHAGVLRAAQGLVRKESTLFQTLQEALKEHKDFGLTFVGHSLGAAIGAAVVMLLGQYHGDDADDKGNDRKSTSSPWRISSNCGLPAGRPIQAIAFAPPATFSYALSTRAAKGGSKPLVYSIVLGADFIPRAGHGQARELRRVLGALSRVRRRDASKRKKRADDKAVKEEDDLQEDARVHVLHAWWEWRKLAKRQVAGSGNKNGKGGLSMEDLQRKRAIEDELWRLRSDVEADLYSAIKRRAMEEESVGTSTSDVPLPPTPWTGPSSAQPLHRLTQRRQTLLDRATLKSEAVLGGIMLPAGRTIYLEEEDDDDDDDNNNDSSSDKDDLTTHSDDNGKGEGTEGESRGISSTTSTTTKRPRMFAVESPLSFFALPEFATTMFASHLPSSYEAVIEDL